jgi:hypothetical protein
MVDAIEHAHDLLIRSTPVSPREHITEYRFRTLEDGFEIAAVRLPEMSVGTRKMIAAGILAILIIDLPIMLGIGPLLLWFAWPHHDWKAILFAMFIVVSGVWFALSAFHVLGAWIARATGHITYRFAADWVTNSAGTMRFRRLPLSEVTRIILRVDGPQFWAMLLADGYRAYGFGPFSTVPEAERFITELVRRRPEWGSRISSEVQTIGASGGRA